MSYPGYGAPAAFSPPLFAPPPASDPTWGFFTAVAGQDGEVDAEELQTCLTQSGFSGSYTRYHVSPRVLDVMVKRYSRGGRIYFDDYVACCVRLRALTDDFRRRELMQQGRVTFQYDDFLLCTMAM